MNKILFSNSNTQQNEYWTTRKQNHNSNITLTSITHHKSSETIDVQKENFTYPYPHKKNRTYQLTTLLYSSALGKVKHFPLSLQPMCLHFPPFHPTKGLELVFQKSWRKSLILLLCFLRCCGTFSPFCEKYFLKPISYHKFSLFWKIIARKFQKLRQKSSSPSSPTIRKGT